MFKELEKCCLTADFILVFSGQYFVVWVLLILKALKQQWATYS